MRIKKLYFRQICNWLWSKQTGFLLFAACSTCLSYLTAVIWPEEYGTLKPTFTVSSSANVWLERLVSEVTYNVLMGTLNPTHSLAAGRSTPAVYETLCTIRLRYEMQLVTFNKLNSSLISNPAWGLRHCLRRPMGSRQQLRANTYTLCMGLVLASLRRRAIPYNIVRWVRFAFFRLGRVLLSV